MTPAQEAAELLQHFGVRTSGSLVSCSPIDGEVIGRVTAGDPDLVAGLAADAFLRWRTVPAPRRGELVRFLGEELRAEKEPHGRRISIEGGKILQGSLG